MPKLSEIVVAGELVTSNPSTNTVIADRNTTRFMVSSPNKKDSRDSFSPAEHPANKGRTNTLRFIANSPIKKDSRHSPSPAENSAERDTQDTPPTLGFLSFHQFPQGYGNHVGGPRDGCTAWAERSPVLETS